MLSIEQSVASVSFMVVMTILAYKVRIIDRYGAIAALPVGFIILYFGSILWFFVILIFFITGSLFTKYKYKQKQNMELAEDNGGARSWKSVVANGAPAAITGGMIATNIDSIFGATIQAKYKCLNCKKYLEKMTIHCNLPVVQERGISMVDNNVVNLLAA